MELLKRRAHPPSCGTWGTQLQSPCSFGGSLRVLRKSLWLPPFPTCKMGIKAHAQEAVMMNLSHKLGVHGTVFVPKVASCSIHYLALNSLHIQESAAKSQCPHNIAHSWDPTAVSKAMTARNIAHDVRTYRGSQECLSLHLSSVFSTARKLLPPLLQQREITMGSTLQVLPKLWKSSSPEWTYDALCCEYSAIG